VQQRLPSLFPTPTLFAHRGASAHAPENTLEAFRLALKLGATGLETDCWLTRDGCVVLDHDGIVETGRLRKLRKKMIANLAFDELPSPLPTIGDLTDLLDDDVRLSIDVCDPRALPLIARTIQDGGIRSRTYICHPSLELLGEWKVRFPEFKYVNSIRLGKISEGPERRCANLAEHGVDVLNMHRTDWNGGLVALAHRFGRAAFSWDLQHPDQLESALLMGVDAVYSDWSDRMVDAYAVVYGDPQNHKPRQALGGQINTKA